MRQPLIVAAVITLSLLEMNSSAASDFYLRSDNKERRCSTLGEWLKKVEQGAGGDLDNISPDKAEDRAIIATAYVDPLFSREFGRGYDELGKWSRRKIYKDLLRCHRDLIERNPYLRVPFSSRSVLSSESGQQWLTSIYRAEFSDMLSYLQGAQGRVSPNRSYKCTSANLESHYQSSGLREKIVDAGLLDEIEDSLRPFVVAQRLSASKSAHAIRREIDNLLYIQGRVTAGNQSVVDEKVYLQVLQDELFALKLLFEPADSGVHMESYLKIVQRLVDAAEIALADMGSDPKYFRLLDYFDSGWVASYASFCATWDPAIAPDSNVVSVLPRVEQNMERLRDAVEEKLYRILTENRAYFVAEIEAVASSGDFEEFDSEYLVQRGAAYNALDRAQLLELFLQLRNDHKAANIAHRQAVQEEAERLEFQYAGFQLRGAGGRGLVSGVQPVTHFEKHPRDLVLAIMGYGVAISESCASEKVPGGLTINTYVATQSTRNRYTGDETNSRVLDDRTFSWPSDFTSIVADAVNRGGASFGALFDSVQEKPYYTDITTLVARQGCGSKALENYHENLLAVARQATGDWTNMTGVRDLLRGLMYGH